MEISEDTARDMAELTKLEFGEEEMSRIVSSMSEILDLVAQMQQVDTSDVEPMANPLDATQRLRPDVVTETNQRAAFQAIAPETEDGLYLVPKVIE